VISLREDPLDPPTSNLEQEVEEIFSPDGLLAKVRNFEYRRQQHEMALEVARTLAGGGHLAIEAGTGVGKSLAYLIPAVLKAVQTGRKAVISTHTIALQEQLIYKDIPLVQKVLPVEFDAVLMKGRQNFLCGSRLERAIKGAKDLFEEAEIAELKRVQEWSRTTTDGSLSDFVDQPPMRVWEEVRSEQGSCTAKTCSKDPKCFYQALRKRVMSADIIVLNHALFFTLASANPPDGPGILFADDFVIFDEAHTLESVAADHIGMDLSQLGLRRALTRLYNPKTRKGLLQAVKKGPLCEAVSSTLKDADNFFSEVKSNCSFGRRNVQRLHEAGVADGGELIGSLAQLNEHIAGVLNELDEDPRRPELADAAGRIREVKGNLLNFLSMEWQEHVYWVEQSGWRENNIRLRAAPVDLADVLRMLLFREGTTGILTSATLAVGHPDLRYFRRRIGGESARSVKVGSPFDYSRQMELHIVRRMPEPKDPGYPDALQTWIQKFTETSAGHAFVLFTSYATMRKVAEGLDSFFYDKGWPLLVQGEGKPPTRMVQEFRESPNSVIFGVDSFWAGVDVPGDALRNVIITRLPFMAPDHPLTEVRLEAIEAAGGRPFEHFSLPEAILKLRQGVGRLIRSKQDHGMVVILDSRVMSKPYGRSFLAAIPDCPRTVH